MHLLDVTLNLVFNIKIVLGFIFRFINFTDSNFNFASISEKSRLKSLIQCFYKAVIGILDYFSKNHVYL